MTLWGRWVALLNGLLDWVDGLLNTGVDPAADAWRKRREALLDKAGTRQEPTYHVYPDAPYRPRMKLVIISGRFMEKVDLDGYSLDEFLPLPALPDRRQQWLLRRIQAARARMTHRLADSERERAQRRIEREEERAAREAARDQDALMDRLAQAHREAEKVHGPKSG